MQPGTTPAVGAQQPLAPVVRRAEVTPQLMRVPQVADVPAAAAVLVRAVAADAQAAVAVDIPAAAVVDTLAPIINKV